MPMALHGKEGGSSSHAMEEGEELRRRGLLLLGTYRVSFFYRKGVVIEFQIGFLGEKDPHPLG